MAFAATIFIIPPVGFPLGARSPAFLKSRASSRCHILCQRTPLGKPGRESVAARGRDCAVHGGFPFQGCCRFAPSCSNLEAPLPTVSGRLGIVREITWHCRHRSVPGVFFAAQGELTPFPNVLGFALPTRVRTMPHDSASSSCCFWQFLVPSSVTTHRLPTALPCLTEPIWTAGPQAAASSRWKREPCCSMGVLGSCEPTTGSPISCWS